MANSTLSDGGLRLEASTIPKFRLARRSATARRKARSPAASIPIDRRGDTLRRIKHHGRGGIGRLGGVMILAGVSFRAASGGLAGSMMRLSRTIHLATAA